MSSIPVLSSSLILVSPSFQILLLKRSSSLSFGSMFAFPGGVIDSFDYEFYSKVFSPIKKENLIEGSAEWTKFMENMDDVTRLLKITALRETFEETGIFITRKSCKSSESKLMELLSYLKQRGDENKEGKSLDFSFWCSIFEPFLDFDPIIRLITIHGLKRRYDTMFFVVQMKENDEYECLNLGEFVRNFENNCGDQVKNNEDVQSKENISKTIKNFKKLAINKSESDDFIWEEAGEINKKYEQDKIQVAPPQLIILKCFEMKGGEEFFNQLTKLKEIQKITREETNNLIREPFSFPILLEIKPNLVGKDNVWLFPGDSKYDYENLSKRESSFHLKKEIFEKNENSKFKRKQTFRIILKPGKKLLIEKFEIDCDFNNIVTECCGVNKPKL